VEVDVSMNALTSLPDLLFCNWPRLRVLDASDNQIKTIPYEGLRDSVELCELRMSNNRLTTYPRADPLCDW
jgi:Leucine-rich repeat (LRR) protein